MMASPASASVIRFFSARPSSMALPLCLSLYFSPPISFFLISLESWGVGSQGGWEGVGGASCRLDSIRPRDRVAGIPQEGRGKVKQFSGTNMIMAL